MKRIPLDDLMAAVAAAVHDAQQALSEQHLGHLKSHFEECDGHLRPRTVPILLPRHHVEEGQEDEAVHEIPQLALTHALPLRLDGVKMELECSVEGLKRGSKSPRLTVALGAVDPESESAGRLTLCFSSGEKPEGVAQLDDHLLKTF